MTPANSYLSICAPYRDDADYLREWIEFHRLVGAERFFLYNNESTDDHEQVLRPYVESGAAVVYDWPRPIVAGGQLLGLTRAFDHCLREHGHESRWIAFLDIDEFLFSPTTASLPQVLTEYEGAPGVCVHRADFGTSGHRRKPTGPVIENYLERVRLPPDTKGYFKSIVDPAQTVRCATVHHFLYRDGFAVNERKAPVEVGLNCRGFRSRDCESTTTAPSPSRSYRESCACGQKPAWSARSRRSRSPYPPPMFTTT
jgi:Glycosyltransferase family 92